MMKVEHGLLNPMSVSTSDHHNDASIYLNTIGSFLDDLQFNCSSCRVFADKFVLVGDGEYNLNAIKEIKVTNSFLGLSEDVRGCQNEKPLDDCITEYFIDNLLNNCGCIPFNLRLTDEVQMYF